MLEGSGDCLSRVSSSSSTASSSSQSASSFSPAWPSRVDSEYGGGAWSGISKLVISPFFPCSISSCVAKCDDPDLDGLGRLLGDADVVGEVMRCELLSRALSLFAAALAAFEERLAACASVARPIIAPTPLTSFSAMFFRSWFFLINGREDLKWSQLLFYGSAWCFALSEDFITLKIGGESNGPQRILRCKQEYKADLRVVYA